MEFISVCNKTSLVLKQERNKKRFQFMITGNTLDMVPVAVVISEVKMRKIRNLIYNYFRKLDGDKICVYSDGWSFPHQQAEIYIQLHECDQIIQIKVSNENDEKCETGTVYLDRTVAEMLLKEIEFLIGAVKGHLV